MQGILKTGVLFLLFLFLVGNNNSYAQGGHGLSLDTVVLARNLDIPWDMEWTNYNLIFFTQLDGTIKTLHVNTKEVKEVYKLNVARELQVGLMGMTLEPDFRDSKKLYIASAQYHEDNKIWIHIDRLRFDVPNKVLWWEETIINDIPGGASSAGVRLMMTPDRKLYVTVGDLEQGETAQDPNSLNGKVLRYNADGTIPADNPFPNSPVWSLGHRNPQGLTFDYERRIYLSEHGTFNNDELNLIEKGRNYGWPTVAGFCSEQQSEACESIDLMEPLQAWTPTIAPCGIAFSKNIKFEELRNSILVAGMKDKSLRALHLSEDGQSVVSESIHLKGVMGRIRDVIVTPQGRLFVCTTNRDIYGEPKEGDDMIIEIIEGDLETGNPVEPEVPEVMELTLDSTDLELNVVADSLFIPWDMEWGNDGWIWFTERNGDINRLHPETGQVQEIYHIDEVYTSLDNSGLHALALHPDFPLEPYLYVNYTYDYYAGRLVRLTYDCNTNTITDTLHLLREMPGHESHNGARLIFAPDGKLLMAAGDSYVAEGAQDQTALNGKILRMNPDGSIPSDNPVPNSRLWSWGHRNPQGLVMTPTGRLYSSEHGPSSDDELNRIERGRNYGWPAVLGYCDLPSEKDTCNALDVREPLLAWTPTIAPCGLAYYDHPAIPEWRNSLLLAALSSGGNGRRIKQINLSDDGNTVTKETNYFQSQFGRIRDILVAPDGRIFFCTSNQEPNGIDIVKPSDDRIIEIRNPNYVAAQDTTIVDPSCVHVYPQPAIESVTVNIHAANTNARLVLYDVGGHIMREWNVYLDGQELLIPRHGLGTGVYYLEVTLSGKESVVRPVLFM